MDDGKVNALSVDMLGQVSAHFDQAEADGAVVILTGRERTLSAGFDLRTEPDGWPEMLVAGARLAERMLSFPRPVVVASTGNAIAMGGFLLLSGDYRVGPRGDFKIGLNEVAIGIAVPGFALELARKRLTPAYLSRTAVTGEMFLPAEAVGAGFLDRVAPPDALADEVAAALEALRRIHLPSHAIVKQRLRAGALQAMRDAIEAELTLEAYARRAAADAAVTFARAG